MTKQVINIGDNPGSSSADTIYDAFKKTNENFDELYRLPATSILAGSNLIKNDSSGNIVLSVDSEFTANTLTLTSFATFSSGSVSASGTVQTDATLLTKTVNNISTGTSNQGVKLPTAPVGTIVYVLNSTGNNIKMYPPTNGTLNGGATNDSITLSSGMSGQYVLFAVDTWIGGGWA